jgi:hypothetical protein
MDYTCTSCNYTGERKTLLAGSNLVSFTLWTVLPTIYMAWELQSFWPALMQDAIGALQAIEGVGINYVDIALSVPGPLYSIWRRVKKIYVCPQCAKKTMIIIAKN